MRVIRLPDVLSQVLAERKTALLLGDSAVRAVVMPLDEYERLVALNDWHERMLKGA